MIQYSKIYRGEVVHERLSPKSHKFSYPMTFFAFDLSELQTIRDSASLFGYNEARPMRLNDTDYLFGRSQSIAEQLETLLPAVEHGQRTVLVTSPRYFGYAFNPVNFHLRMGGDQLLSVVAEVNNTFGDRHVYPLVDLEKVKAQTWTAKCPKEFHVSPFNDMAGEYHFTFRIEAEEIYLGVNLHRDGACVMKTWIQGKSHALTNKSICRYALSHPFDTAFNSMPRIIWQAALLYYKKKMDVYKRPSPHSVQTLVDRDSKGRGVPIV